MQRLFIIFFFGGSVVWRSWMISFSCIVISGNGVISIFVDEAILKTLTVIVPMYLLHTNTNFSAGPGPFCVNCADPAHCSHYF